MSRNKKLSLPLNDMTEKFIYKPKDLVWAKMKGFTPWPGMIVEPPLDLINQPHRANCRCVFFFGTRNFGWIEDFNMKPFEGPWKEELAKIGKPLSFRTALVDINKYMEDPVEMDAIIDEKCGMGNHSHTEADFDKIRDGITEDEPPVINNANNGEVERVPHVVGSPDEYDIATGGVTPPPKTPSKRTPKPKSAVPTVTRRKSATGKSTKRRASAMPNSTNATKRAKRSGSAENVLADFAEYEESAPAESEVISTSEKITHKVAPSQSRRRLSPETLLGSRNNGSNIVRRPNAVALLNRPPVPRPQPRQVDMKNRSRTLIDREITPSALTFGFLGLGIMGSTIVKDLLFTGHKVVVWNRTSEKCKMFIENGAEIKDTPMDVVEAADIILCCVSDPKGAKDLVFGNCGVLQIKDLRNKAYVEMSTIDPETSQDIGEGIRQCNGRYLEAQIHGSRDEAIDGMLIILAGGDRTVFEECHSCFKTIAKNTFFLGEIGNACKVNLILQTILGVSLVGLAEALALADRFSISLNDILDIFELTSMKSPLLVAKGKEMAKGDFNPQQPLNHMQRDLRLVLNMAENLDQSMPVTGITNEVFKHTKRLGYSDHDSSAVFVRSRF